MKTNRTLKTSFFALSLAGLTLTSCKKDKDNVPSPAAPNENEVITTFKFVMMEEPKAELLRAAPLIFTWKDMDGEGGKAPTQFDTIRLKPNTNYSTAILLLDETKNPVDTISYEVEEEADEHQFFFESLAGLDLAVKYDDEDKNKVPVGLQTTFEAKAAGKGNLRVLLKHQPGTKPKTGSGDKTKGSTDIDLVFPVQIDFQAMIFEK